MIRVYKETNPVFCPETQDFYRKALALGVMRIGIQSCLIRRSALLQVGGFDENLPKWIGLELFIRLTREYKFQFKLVKTGAYEMYHVTNQGITSWYEFAKEILRQAGINVPVVAVSSDEYTRPAKRPKNSVLDPFPLKETNGYLASTETEWLESFRCLQHDKRLRMEMGKAGRAKVEKILFAGNGTSFC